MGGRRRTGRYLAPVCAQHRADPARMAGAHRRPPAEEILRRAALGKAHGTGFGLRARHFVRTGGVQPAPHRLRQDQSRRGARNLHPRCPGRRRFRDPRAVLRAQPEAGARDRKPRAQVAPARRAGRRRTDRGVLRQADPGRHLQRHRLREMAQGRQRQEPEALVPEPRRADAARGGRRHHRAVSQADDGGRHRHGPELSLRTGRGARRRDARRAAVRLEPGVGGALRVAGARHAEGEGAPAAEVAAAEAAPPLRAAARLCRRLRRAHRGAPCLRQRQPARCLDRRRARADWDCRQGSATSSWKPCRRTTS